MRSFAIGTSEKLPIDDFLLQIEQAIREHQNLVLVASPGAGKTTRVPPYLVSRFPGQIFVLEPRRVAAIAAATRIAQEQGWMLGDEVGYHVRHDKKYSATTKLIFVTEAMLNRKLLADPELKEVSLIILDEFHERSVQVDTSLALLRDLQEMGHDLKLIIMSATLNAQKLAIYLRSAPIIDIPGSSFELEINHWEKPLRPRTDAAFFIAMTEAIFKNISSPGDLLVFLPGVGEIERLYRALQDDSRLTHLLIHRLHGSLPLDQQAKVLQKSKTPRIILSTNIAESSVTISGVNKVIDSGLAKTMRFDLNTGFQRLEVTRISKNSAIQRAGRAARQGPGKCLRMWSKHEENTMIQNTIPEIQRTDLAATRLYLAAMGYSKPETMTWFEPPPESLLNRSYLDLFSMEAIDSDGRITATGKTIAGLPLDPVLGRLMSEALLRNQPQLGAFIGAIVQERDFLNSFDADTYLSDQWECDLQFRLQNLFDFLQKSSNSIVHRNRAQTVKLAAQQIFSAIDETYGPLKIPKEWGSEAVSQLLFHSFLHRLCRRRGKSARALMVGGRGVKIHEASLVRDSEFFFALEGGEIAGQNETLVRKASGISKNLLFQLLGSRIESVVSFEYDTERETFYKKSYKQFQGLPLEEPQLAPLSGDDLSRALMEHISSNFNWFVCTNQSIQRWQARWKMYLRFTDQGQVKDLFTENELRQAVEMGLVGESSLPTLIEKDFTYFLDSQIPVEHQKRFGDGLPCKLKVPSGSFIKINYPTDADPFLEVRVQELFGLNQHPCLLNGKFPLILHLLGPNYRPVQITSDLLSFWKIGYLEVRKELRARYPKHSWPEDPLTAVPVAKGKSYRA